MSFLLLLQYLNNLFRFMNERQFARVIANWREAPLLANFIDRLLAALPSPTLIGAFSLAFVFSRYSRLLIALAVVLFLVARSHLATQNLRAGRIVSAAGRCPCSTTLVRPPAQLQRWPLWLPRVPWR